MKKIKSLSLSGFQSHTESCLDFHPGFNVIIGSNNSGKTAIIRALKKVCFDTPLGGDFVNDEMDICKIDLYMDSGDHICRFVQISRDDKSGKGSVSDHYYQVDGDEFRGFGTNIPDEVHQAHGMVPVNIGKGNILLNFHFQLDPPFLLSDSSSIKAKVLSLISGADIIDRAIVEVNKRIRDHNQKIKDLKNRVEQWTQEFKVPPDEDTLLEFVEKVSDSSGRIKQLTKDIKKCVDLFQELKREGGTNKNLQRILERVGNRVEQSNTILERCDAVITEGRDLDWLVSEFISLRRDVKRMEEPLDRIDPVLQNIHETLDRCVEEFDHLSLLREKMVELNNVTEVVGNMEQKKKHLENRCKFILDEITKLIDSLEGMCPVCGGTDGDLEAIVDNL